MALAFEKNKQQQDARKAENIPLHAIGNLNVAILNDNHISDIAEILRNKEENHADLIVGFFYVPDGDTFKVVYSLRSNDVFDCSKYAKSNGGGGHVKAAGFTVNRIGSEFNPINYLTDNLYNYLQTIS
jgi:nanoRNase/pAp phosphatase (c-di-AMP/oligoRNAs hydrolase)